MYRSSRMHSSSATPRRGNRVCGFLAALLTAQLLLFSSAEGQTGRTDDLNRRIEQARSLERLRQYDRAVAIFERVLRDDPDNRSALNGAVRLYFRLNAFGRAIPLLETHIEKNPDRISLRGMLAEALFGVGRNGDAEEQIRILQDRFPQSESAVTEIAYLYLDRQAYDKAIQTFLSGRKRLGKPGAFALGLASVYTSAYDIPGAVREYVRWLTEQPRQQRIVSDRIDLLTGLGGQELVEESLKSAMSEHSGSKDAHDLLGSFYLRSDKPTEALAAYRVADRLDGASGKYLIRFAEWALREGHHRNAIDTYQELTRTTVADSLRAEAYSGLAMAFQESGAVNDAAETYRNIIAQYPESRFRNEAVSNLAEMHLVHYRDAPQALDLYRSLLDGPDGPADASTLKYRENALFGIAESYVVMGSLEDALVYYNRIRDPGSGFAESETRARTNYHLGELALFQGRLDEALELFHETADRYSGSPYANDALEWTILIAEGRQGGDRSFTEYIRSVLLQRRHRDREALAACKSLVEEHAQSPIADTVILDIGMILGRLGKPFQAVAALRDLIERHPDSRHVAAARRWIAEIYETSIGDIPQALTEYEALILSHPDHFKNDAVRRKIRELTANHPSLP